MRAKILLVSTLSILLLLVNCANYKLLKPEPLLSSKEGSYIELKDKKKDFKLKEGKKYFIEFPAPKENNFYLVLTIPSKEHYNSFLTTKLEKKKFPGTKIEDETAKPERMSVFPIDKSAPVYYWLIDHIKQDVELKMEYRYVPQWRFRFENKHAEFNETLKKNRVSRTIYKTLGTSFHFNGFNFNLVMDTVAKHTEALNKMHKEVLAIESVFPSDIVNSTDKAYLDYKKLKKDLEEEIQFQNNYVLMLNAFDKEYKSRRNPIEFIGYVEDFIKFFSMKKEYPDNVFKEGQTVFKGRLGEIVPFYEQRLSGKDDEMPFDQKLYKLKEFNRIDTLFTLSEIPAPANFTNLLKFINGFDKRSNALDYLKKGLAKLHKAILDLPEMPTNEYFPDIVSKAEAIQKKMPPQLAQEYGKYLGYKCSQALNKAIDQFKVEIGKRIGEYREAETLVPQINTYKSKLDYKEMLALLKPNVHLDFLMEKYRGIDTLSVKQQDKEVRDALADYRWSEAEAGLTRLHHDKNFLNPSAVFALKDRTVKNLEDSLYITVDRISRYRVNKFLEEKIDTLEHIDSLYKDSVFLPAYTISFSTGTKRELIQRKEDLIAHLAKQKENQFPMKAVKLLYERFIKNPNEKGVAMARAIVRHGEHYKGDDKKTKRRIAECNPWSSKWIVKAKQYRKVFALPVTDKKRGENRYFLRLNLRIPTEAKFPVYDIYIKLPKEVARNAATEQWYEKILLNKTLLKNEGRFTITAPTAENKFECQMGPAPMRKDKNNFLDIYFKHNSYKVFTVSVMAQKPIIKKH